MHTPLIPQAIDNPWYGLLNRSSLATGCWHVELYHSSHSHDAEMNKTEGKNLSGYQRYLCDLCVALQTSNSVVDMLTEDSCC